MEIVGLAVFSVIKYTGYFLYLKFACPQENAPNIYVVALARLLAGLVVGMSIYFVFGAGRNIFPVYFSAILTGRVVIWFFIFQLFYKSLDLKQKLKLTIGGTFVSYLLDLPSSLGLWVTVGGIC